MLALAMRHVDTKSQPLLGRWCAPHYSDRCDQMRKADLNIADHSFEPISFFEQSEQCKRVIANKGTLTSDVCPWSNPLATVQASGFGR